jgi:CRP-like cAMP-binding protein
MSNFIELNEEESKSIEEAFPIMNFEKGHELLKTGQVAKDAFLVIEGCIRKYAFNVDGEEFTSDFFTEFQSAINLDSIANRSPSKYFLTCTEKTTVAIINAEKETELYKKHPRFGEVCRVEMEKMMGQSQEKLSIFMRSTPEERYLSILKDRPDLINRVPQYQLASYLDIKPETLSRIRKRISLKD